MSPNESFVDLIDGFIASQKCRLPVFNPTAARIQQEVNNPDPDVRLVERLISSDQALTAKVLSLSNSSFYKGLNRMTTVQSAIVRLGINEVSNIVMMVTHENNFRSRNPFIHKLMHGLWRHSIGCALASHWLAKNSGLQTAAHEAFFAGLLHDVGKLVVLTVTDDLAGRGKMTIIPSQAVVREAMDTLHARCGHTLMTHWNLPQKYAQVACDHHLETVDPENHLACVVRLANRACHKLGIGLKLDAQVALTATAEAVALRLSDVDCARLLVFLEDSNVYRPPEAPTGAGDAVG